jgi:hypothetical protein
MGGQHETTTAQARRIIYEGQPHLCLAAVGISISGGDGIVENNRIEKPKPAGEAGQRNEGARLRPGDSNQAGSPR